MFQRLEGANRPAKLNPHLGVLNCGIKQMLGHRQSFRAPVPQISDPTSDSADHRSSQPIFSAATSASSSVDTLPRRIQRLPGCHRQARGLTFNEKEPKPAFIHRLPPQTFLRSLRRAQSAPCPRNVPSETRRSLPTRDGSPKLSMTRVASTLSGRNFR